MGTNINKKSVFSWFICMLFPVIIAFLPTSAEFTGSLKLFLVLTIFVILIIALELLPRLVSAILLPSLYMITGLVPAEIAFSSWTSTTVWMVLGGLIFSNVLDETGLLKRIAYYVIRKCGGNLCWCGIWLFLYWDYLKLDYILQRLASSQRSCVWGV